MNKQTLCFAFTVLAGVCVTPDITSAQARGPAPRVAQIHAKPAGQSYGRWAAEWWQWALGIPGAVNPLTDATGEHCAQRQVDSVWFLAGSFSSEPVVRSCEIPAGKSLFFPLINSAYGAFLNDPPATRTAKFVRAAASCTEAAQISVSIDASKFRNRRGSSPALRAACRPSSACSCRRAICSESMKASSPSWS